MRRPAAIGWWVVLLGCSSPQVWAQADIPVRASAASSGAVAPANLSSGAPMGAGGLPQGFIGEVVLEGSEKDSNGIASVTWKNAHNSLQFKATAPLRGGTATPFTLDGLSADSRIELSYNRIEFPVVDRPGALRVVSEIVDRKKAECRDDPTHPLRMARPASKPEDACTSKAGDLRYLTGADLVDARNALASNGRIWFWGGGLTAARTTFDYLDEGTLAEQSVEKRSLSWNARAGFFTGYFGFVIGSYSFVKQWDAAGAAQNICQPLEGTNATVCGNAVIGAPVETTRSLVGGELRKFFSSGIAFAPNIRRDLKKKATFVTLPVYFLKNKDGAATGGVRLTWRSDTEATTVSVFVGGALSPN